MLNDANIRQNNFSGQKLDVGRGTSAFNADPNAVLMRSLESRIKGLENKLDNHFHDGNMGQRINLFDIFGKIECLSSAPTGAPDSIWDQVKVATVTGTTYLYIYDSNSATWKKVTIA